jgi:predicted transposase/invertase (TIGR01784 family)
LQPKKLLKTDSLFYRLFQNFPALLFELIDISVPKGEQYQFKSVELKQTAFRIDGLFVPPESETDSPIFFVEVQFQGDAHFYSRFFSEIFLYLRQYKPLNPWQGVVIYPSRRIDTGRTHHYQGLLESPQVRRIYLDELEVTTNSISLSLMKLVVTPEAEAITVARGLVTRTKQEINNQISQRQILDLLETIIVYKLPNLSREEIIQMLGFTEIDVKQTRFYQDVYAEGAQEGKLEGKQEGEVALILRLLNRRFGELETSQVEVIRGLEITQLEDLAIALLDFTSMTDLKSWLQEYS